MEFMDVVRKRRSIRKYKKDPVPKKMILEVMEAARLAPSAGNRQPWHFVVVTDPETKNKLGLSPWAAEAPVVIVGCGDSQASSSWYGHDLMIAFEHLVLAAANLGLGTCWMGRMGRDETIKMALGIPEHVKVIAVTPLGYPDEEPGPRERKSLEEFVHWERF
ncbi:MAG: nitroreductase family protein [Candidatus Bathyarchaeia archaeon]